MASFDTSRLVQQIIIKGALPTGTYQDIEILDMAYDCLLSEIVPMVMSARQDYYVTYVDIPVGVNASFFIPYRAQNGVLREVKLVRGGSVLSIDRIKLDDVTDTAPGIPKSFYVDGNSVYLYPAPANDNGDVLRLYYWVRPSRLVTTAECATITAINGNVLSILPPSSWSTANSFDLVRGRAHFDILAMDLVASSITGTSITLSSVPSSLAVGDVVCLSEETCYPFLPPEGHGALVQSAVATALEAMGDPNAATAAQKATAYKQSFADILKIRVEGSTSIGRRLL